MSSVKEILAGIKDPKILGELKEIMASNDDKKLKAFLKTLSGDIKAKAKVKASVEEAPAETKAALIPSDYEWFRYKGSRCKNIPYADAVICVQPDDVLGISSIVDYLGNSKVIFPAYKSTPISLSKDVLALVKNRCNAYTGDVAKLLASVEASTEVVANKGEQNTFIKELDGLYNLIPLFIKEKNEMHLALKVYHGSCPVVIESKIKRPFRAEGSDEVLEEMTKRLKDVEKKFNEKYKQLYRDYFDACQKEIDKLEDDIDSKKVNFN